MQVSPHVLFFIIIIAVVVLCYFATSGTRHFMGGDEASLGIHKSLGSINLDLKPAVLAKKPREKVISKVIANARSHIHALDIIPTKLSITALKRDLAILTHLINLSNSEDDKYQMNECVEEIRVAIAQTQDTVTISPDRETMLLELTTQQPDARDTTTAANCDSYILQNKTLRDKVERLETEARMKRLEDTTDKSQHTYCLRQNEELHSKIASLRRDIETLRNRPNAVGNDAELNRCRSEKSSLESEVNRLRRELESSNYQLTMNLSKAEDDLRRCNQELNTCIDVAARM